MRVLIQTLGSAGDTHPFIGVGEALRKRGHDVVLLANEVFANAADRAGLGFIPIGDAEAFLRINEDPDISHPTKSLEVVFGGLAIPELRSTIDVIEANLDETAVLVGSTAGFAARIVRELHDVPLVTAHLAPTPFRSYHRLPRSERMLVGDSSPMWMKRAWWSLGDAIADRAVGPEFNVIRAERGLEPLSKIFDQWIHSPDRTLGLFPSWFGPPQPDWPENVRLTGFPLYDEGDQRPVDDDLEGWLADGVEPVIFTGGSSNVLASPLFSAALSVCQTLDLRAVFVTTNPEDVPSELPTSIRHETYVPFGRLLPRSRALVSHGGIGSCAQALAAGIPHLVTHRAFDQRDNGSRLQDLGVGSSIPAGRFRGRRALHAVSSVLEESLETAARELSMRVDRLSALDATCREIEAVATGV